MGKLKYLVVHCTDTPPNMNVDKAKLEEWHMSPKPKGRGWDRLGYSDLIKRDGSVINLTPYDDDDFVSSSEMTWGAAGVNAYARHVVLEGGRTEENKDPGMADFMDLFTAEQFCALQEYAKEFIAKDPNDKVVGHYYFSDTKTCPNFNVGEFLELIEIPEDLIV
ncbi:lysozyme [Marinifilum breve]|uniref:Lysozyme n=1 Tax=Marinifilum breve TaxID=2184082 RepID=A0A2V3ZRT6_9BACT|nr:N-acetylmuramoyl-L-alanine amidase [Marinifilum breve]PXX96911.1 lysozyme [Marinifilum breve]